MPHAGYQPYNPAAVVYNANEGGEEEDEEEADGEHDPYYRSHPYQYYPSHHGYRSGPSHSDDTELRSPGIARRFPRHVIMKESEE